MFLKTLFLIICGLGISVTHAQTSTALSGNSKQPSYRLAGFATLTSNFVEKGLTQTKDDPGMQAEFWFNFGQQFRMGLWGANVRYEDTPTTHFWLKGNADVKVEFSSATSMNIVYSMNNYYKANNRNGNTVGFHFDFWGYKVHYDMESNWEGTKSKAQYLSVGKDTILWTDWLWTNGVGYILPKEEGIKSFFDFRTGLGTKAKDILLMANATYTYASGAFKKQGDLHLFVSASVAF